MFGVDHLDDIVARLLARGAELVGEVVQDGYSSSDRFLPEVRRGHLSVYSWGRR
jgi:hypothetical protein